MTAKELAALLDGRQVGCELTDGEERQAEKSGLVALYTPNCDTAVLTGAIQDTLRDLRAPFYISRDGFLPPANCDAGDNYDCPFYRAALLSVIEVRGAFQLIDWPCWTLETDIPHETFRTYTDDEIYCIGLVFRLEDLPGGAS